MSCRKDDVNMFELASCEVYHFTSDVIVVVAGQLRALPSMSYSDSFSRGLLLSTDIVSSLEPLLLSRRMREARVR